MNNEEPIEGAEFIQNALNELGEVQLEDDTTDDLPAEEPEDESQPEEDEELTRAKASGWKEEKDYKGPPGKWKDYKEFNKVGDTITKTLQRKIDAQNDAIKALIQNQSKIASQEYERAVKELTAKKREAIRDGDIEAVETIDTQIAEASKQKQEMEVKIEEEVSQKTPDPEVQAFVSRNASWWEATDQISDQMRNFAIAQETIEIRLDPKASMKEIMARVEQSVKVRFPDKFKRALSRVPSVESGSKPPKTASKEPSFDKYPKYVRDMAAVLEKAGISKAEYLAELQKESSR
jgi:hypothetical protein